MARPTITQCPHCHSNCTVKRSQQLSPMCREITAACSNVECGWTGVFYQEPVRTLSPSALPDPAISIPISSHINTDNVKKSLQQTA
ncbi:ogr/Delta-like zinc finger family protein [Sedimenticola hydrogenitrophicus]|uniref:ogr/Delta-like zinc finger family protein n=1 Tax=Sedimenticola hydrogenitrophicus TaxID=2967975 RepID=UPI003B587D63